MAGRSCAALHPGDVLVICSLPSHAAPLPAAGSDGPLAVAQRWHRADTRTLLDGLLEALESQIGGAARELGLIVVRAADPAPPGLAGDEAGR
jgi:hypothetical protein